MYIDIKKKKQNIKLKNKNFQKTLIFNDLVL